MNVQGGNVELEAQKRWPGSVSVRELGCRESFDKVPQEYRAYRTPLKGHSGVFVGRGEELDRLTVLFEGMHMAARPDDDDPPKRFVALVTNAPGAGKSALIEEFNDRMTANGLPCISIKPELFAQPEKMIATIVDYVADTAAGRWNHRIQSAVDFLTSGKVAANTGAAVEGVVAAPLAAGIAAGGTRILQRAMKPLAKRWTNEPPETMEAALEQLSATCPKGFVVIVDECTALGGANLDRTLMQTHLWLITDTEGEELRKIHGGLLMAGLGSAEDVADELKLSRALTIWLGAPSCDEAEEIIRQMLAEAVISDERKERLLWTWPAALARDFHSWMEHTAEAGDIAARVAEATEPPMGVAATDEQILAWVRICTANAIKDLYEGRIKSTQAALNFRGPERIVALADLTDNRMPYEAIEVIARQCREEKESGKVTTERVERAVRELKEAGMICPADAVVEGETSWDYATIPMPSLRRYINEKKTPEVMQRAMTVAVGVLREVEPELLPAKLRKSASRRRPKAKAKAKPRTQRTASKKRAKVTKPKKRTKPKKDDR